MRRPNWLRSPDVRSTLSVHPDLSGKPGFDREERAMHPSISQALASEHIEDARRLATEQRRVAEVAGDDDRAGRRRFSRYFSHTREGHIKSLRRAHRGTRGAGARPA